MKESNRVYVAPTASEAQPRRISKHHKPLKSLSTRRLWILLESVEYQMRNSLFYPKAYGKALNKRHSDISVELNDRLEFDEYLCSIDPDYVTDKWGHRIINNELNELEDLIRDAIEAPRKFQGKSYIGRNGYKARLRPGPKIVANRRGRKVYTY